MGEDIAAAMIPMPPGTYIERTSVFTGKLDQAGRKVWKHKSPKHPFYLTWDELHGEIEVFSIKRMKHRAVYYPNGNYKGPAVPDRYLEFKK